MPGEVGLLVAYNVAFVLPLLGIVAVLLLAADRAGPMLERADLDPATVAGGARGPAAARRQRAAVVVGGAGLVKG